MDLSLAVDTSIHRKRSQRWVRAWLQQSLRVVLAEAYESRNRYDQGIQLERLIIFIARLMQSTIGVVKVKLLLLILTSISLTADVILNRPNVALEEIASAKPREGFSMSASDLLPFC
eukprot:scaffold3682_cov70-Cylindrotheca_fusiformis.AAC.2